jgi:hypothetical protein
VMMERLYEELHASSRARTGETLPLAGC